MSRKVQKLEVAAILAPAQSFSGPRFVPTGLLLSPADQVECQECASRQLALTEQRRQQKRPVEQLSLRRQRKAAFRISYRFILLSIIFGSLSRIPSWSQILCLNVRSSANK